MHVNCTPLCQTNRVDFVYNFGHLVYLIIFLPTLSDFCPWSHSLIQVYIIMQASYLKANWIKLLVLICSMGKCQICLYIIIIQKKKYDYYSWRFYSDSWLCISKTTLTTGNTSWELQNYLVKSQSALLNFITLHRTWELSI